MAVYIWGKYYMEDKPTHRGQEANQGRMIPRNPHEGEGFALVLCGGTEILLSYTVLHRLCGHLAMGAHHDANVRENGAVLRAFCAITCEASQGHTPALLDVCADHFRARDDQCDIMNKPCL